MQTPPQPDNYHAHPSYQPSPYSNGSLNGISNGQTRTGAEMYNPNQNPYQQQHQPPPSSQQQGYYYTGYPPQQGQASNNPQQQHQQPPQHPLSLPPVGSIAPPQSYHPSYPPPQPQYGGAYQLPGAILQGQPGPAPRLPVGQQPRQAAVDRKMSESRDDGKYIYSLHVEQQPQRARMCGFGDKDRRPLTPPPCIRLVIRDVTTKEEVNVSDIDGSFFILTVDLYDANADREVNIVRATAGANAQAISSATMTSYPPTQDNRMSFLNTGPSIAYPGMAPGPMPMSYEQPEYGVPHPYGGLQYTMGPLPVPQTQMSNSLFTRNLIGSLAVNAAKLYDPQNKTSYWFVLQDLSVRTEGHFRLKMSFVNVGAGSTGGLNRGRAPVLAFVFSEQFQVFSAKRFPGVIESTDLSKCFSAQGIKIPIRKDTTKESKEEEGSSPEA
ncbi:hypothetical protein BAUCODRAFT_127220 [Baudoinia panamericana UAMH 10762]|uniref:Velvet domain-containing protein n=1 Tax=Baudoinia panamericana (strain UAMH 10762) TaxID=717646 RepID=M2LBQ8_BAUPA|nr:uncharacterized protein BAUCODRAFT_127220 [Baudoinia panamericana UAMH 10762]EMC91312.1 hypothetical protein BAUCODRAFT_127220 [Baudoinia panamericana UAMH 10762]